MNRVRAKAKKNGAPTVRFANTSEVGTPHGQRTRIPRTPPAPAFDLAQTMRDARVLLTVEASRPLVVRAVCAARGRVLEQFRGDGRAWAMYFATDEELVTFFVTSWDGIALPGLFRAYRSIWSVCSLHGQALPVIESAPDLSLAAADAFVAGACEAPVDPWGALVEPPVWDDEDRSA